MSLVEDAKKMAEQVSGWKRPARADLAALVRKRKPLTFGFDDDGIVPNNPDLPLVVYRSPIRLADDLDPAAIFEELFQKNSWDDSWRNGIYDYWHYHSRIHEVLGLARGRVRVQFGGPNGRAFELKAGDVAILPAGTGHQCLRASRDLLVVGAYPRSGTYDECRTSADHAKAVRTIPKVALPRKDPVYGADGPLRRLWK
jgi:uncharacterized protein YjlB